MLLYFDVYANDTTLIIHILKFCKNLILLGKTHWNFGGKCIREGKYLPPPKKKQNKTKQK